MHVYVDVDVYGSESTHWPRNRLGRPFRDKGL